jgi:hypothetical protein
MGLSRPLPALSPKYIAAAFDAALDRLQALGSYVFTQSGGEGLCLLDRRQPG